MNWLTNTSGVESDVATTAPAVCTIPLLQAPSGVRSHSRDSWTEYEAAPKWLLVEWGNCWSVLVYFAILSYQPQQFTCCFSCSSHIPVIRAATLSKGAGRSSRRWKSCSPCNSSPFVLVSQLTWPFCISGPHLWNRDDNNTALPQVHEPARISIWPIRRHSAAYYRNRDPIYVLKKMKGKNKGQRSYARWPFHFCQNVCAEWPLLGVFP